MPKHKGAKAACSGKCNAPASIANKNSTLILVRVLIEILHPAHVHFFRNFISDMELRGHEISVAARDKDVTIELLNESGIGHAALSTQARGTIGLAKELVTRVRGLGRLIKDWRPDVLTGVMGPTIVLAGRRHRIPSVVFYDTELATRTNSWVFPLAGCVITPDCYSRRVRGRHITYPGYQELAYLHPTRFQPDSERLARHDLTTTEPFTVVRFVAFHSSHDAREMSVPFDIRLEIIRRLEAVGRVVISSESPLPRDLEPYRMAGQRSDLHHVMAYASAVIGESATMATEAASLGVPAVFVGKTSRGYIDELSDRYGLIVHRQPDDAVGIYDAIESVMTEPRSVWRDRRAQMLADKTDVTSWMINWFEGGA